MAEFRQVDGDLSKEKYNVLKKAGVGQIYLQLPLLKVFMCLVPISYSSPKIMVPKTDSSTLLPSGGWQTSGEYVPCPIYDHDVVVHLMYCTVVITLMAYTSYHNMKLLELILNWQSFAFGVVEFIVCP